MTTKGNIRERHENKPKYDKEYYQKNKEKLKIYRRIYVNKNKEKINTYLKEYRKNNQEKIKGWRDNFNRENPGYYREYAKKKSVKKATERRVDAINEYIKEDMEVYRERVLDILLNENVLSIREHSSKTKVFGTLLYIFTVIEGNSRQASFHRLPKEAKEGSRRPFKRCSSFCLKLKKTLGGKEVLKGELLQIQDETN